MNIIIVITNTCMGLLDQRGKNAICAIHLLLVVTKNTGRTEAAKDTDLHMSKFQVLADSGVIEAAEGTVSEIYWTWLHTTRSLVF